MYLFSEYRHVLETLGFDIEPADNGAVTVNGVPQGFSTAPEDVEKMLPELIMALSDDHLSASEGMLSSLAGRLAWLGSVNSNPVRTQVEAQRLIDDLFACTNTEFTESGHRIVSVLTEDEIAKMFG